MLGPQMPPYSVEVPCLFLLKPLVFSSVLSSLFVVNYILAEPFHLSCLEKDLESFSSYTVCVLMPNNFTIVQRKV